MKSKPAGYAEGVFKMLFGGDPTWRAEVLHQEFSQGQGHGRTMHGDALGLTQ